MVKQTIDTFKKKIWFLLYQVWATQKQTVNVEEEKSDHDFEKGTVVKKAW